jgi:Mrp family chromosome partitioning ATPase
VAALQTLVDVIIFEVPSFLSVHHGEGLAPLADVVLVVGERRNTKLNEIRKTREALMRLGAPVVGMALTRAPEGTYVWGHYSDLGETFDPEAAEEIDQNPAEEHDTAQLPVVQASDNGSETSHDDEAMVDLATPDA